MTSSKPDLSSLRILLPRPRREKDSFVEALQSLGGQLYSAPVIDIVPLLVTENDRDALVESLGGCDHIIFVSRNAAEMALEALTFTSGKFPETARIYAIGHGTAEVLSTLGVDALYSPEANSEGLLARPELAHVKGKSVLICRGEGGRDKLRDVLQSRGAKVSYHNLYQRRPSARWRDKINALVDGGNLDLVAIHSGEILAALLALLSPNSKQRLKTLPVLVPGDRVASLAQSQGCDNILVAESALPESMVAALVHWYTQQQCTSVSRL